MPEFKSSLLGGRGDEKKASNIPDELPSLVEESVKPLPTEIPDDLPEISPEIEKKIYANGKSLYQLPLGPEEEEDKRLREYIGSELKKGFSLDEIKDVLIKAGHPAIHVDKIIGEFRQKGTEPQKIPEPETLSYSSTSSAGAELKLSKRPGFFSNLLNAISKHDEAKEKLLTGDLFARMEQDWKIREKEHKEEIVITTEQQLRKQMTDNIEELEDLENKWQIQKSVIEAETQKLADKEKAIKERVSELKKILHKLEFHKNVAPDHSFRFINGIVIKNMQELIDALKVIDDATFRHHVNAYRNDINAWVYHAVGKENISSMLSEVKSREDTIRILEEIKEKV
jgi:hypothetical protein